MEEKIAQHFRERAETFDKIGMWVKDPSIMAMTLEFMDFNRNTRMIDIGAGTGKVLESVLSVFPDIKECVALDISQEMLNKITDNRIKKCLCDTHKIPFSSNYFDVALCRQSLHYMKDVQKVFREIYKVLVPSGSLIIGQITPFSEKDEEYWKTILRIRQPLRKHFLTLDELIALLKNGFFKPVKVTQIIGKESLNSWLSRYRTSNEQIEKVRNLHYNAPPIYKKIHNFIETENDIIFDNCWTFIQAVKNKQIEEGKI